MSAACLLVQSVNVLGNDRPELSGLFQRCQLIVGSIWPGRKGMLTQQDLFPVEGIEFCCMLQENALKN